VKVTVLYFAALREALGCAREEIDLPAQVDHAAALQAHLRARGGVWAEALAPQRPVRVSVNQQMASGSTPLTAGAEVAFFPPVTGG